MKEYPLWANYPTYLMSGLIESCTTLFNELSFDEMWEAGFVHHRIFEQSEWCKREQSEHMEMIEYIENELKSVLK